MRGIWIWLLMRMEFKYELNLLVDSNKNKPRNSKFRDDLEIGSAKFKIGLILKDANQ